MREIFESGQNSVPESREAEAVDDAGSLEQKETPEMIESVKEPQNNAAGEKTAEMVYSAPVLDGPKFPEGGNPVFPEVTGGISLQRLQVESHLGKGIIKPQAVEVDVDGVHFKYDMPAHIFSKPETPKEKQPREYRFTGIEAEQKFFEEPAGQEDVKAETAAPEIAGPAGERVADESIIIEVSPESAINEPVSIASETMVESKPAGEELIKEEPLKEMPVKEEPPPETIKPEPAVLWEGRQTWLGIPLGNTYRITNRSLIIFGRHNNKLLEIGLSLITEVAVRSPWWSRLFGLSDLVIAVKEFTPAKIILSGLAQPVKVKEMLENIRQCKL
ncbi:MAG: hypothetical protein ACM3X9_00690 [Bacillota bacterium]